MGRANVYLPDDLERRVKAARIPVSEVCQQALLKAVEAAESARPSLGDGVAGAYRQGALAGEGWARAASPVPLLTLLRDGPQAGLSARSCCTGSNALRKP